MTLFVEPLSVIPTATNQKRETTMTETIRTHQQINHQLCGKPLEVKDGTARVEMTTRADMAVDSMQLVHGGFVFGLADHAAMIAVNDRMSCWVGPRSVSETGPY